MKIVCDATSSLRFFRRHFNITVVILRTRGTLTAFENGFSTLIPGSITRRVLFVDALVTLLTKLIVGWAAKLLLTYTYLNNVATMGKKHVYLLGPMDCRRDSPGC